MDVVHSAPSQQPMNGNRGSSCRESCTDASECCTVSLFNQSNVTSWSTTQNHTRDRFLHSFYVCSWGMVAELLGGLHGLLQFSVSHTQFSRIPKRAIVISSILRKRAEVICFKIYKERLEGRHPSVTRQKHSWPTTHLYTHINVCFVILDGAKVFSRIHAWLKRHNECETNVTPVCKYSCNTKYGLQSDV